ncbi:MAG: trypsin-like peptidase domain-containing protein, partial [Trueperaceae bacterium]|nr:trypsin-like peptidase domain-containing protein [Trueperaceae bacterium]
MRPSPIEPHPSTPRVRTGAARPTAARGAIHPLAWALTATLVLAATVAGQTQAQVTPLDEAQALLQDEANTVSVVETYGPSVVSVTVEVQGQAVDPFAGLREQIPPQFRDFFSLPAPPNGSQLRQGSGSGFVVAGGRLITNYHVVRDALEDGGVTLREGARVRITFAGDDEGFDVRVVGANPDVDLALLELVDPAAAPPVAPIPLGDGAVRVGQKAIAIGNPFGLANTVTSG